MLKIELKRYLLITLGTVSLSLGVVGIFLPVLPTTPLLLATAYCYVRSSPSLYRWLTGHRVLGRYLRDYLERRTVPRRAKAVALGALWPSLHLSMLFIPLLGVRILVALVGLGVSIYLIRLPEGAAA